MKQKKKIKFFKLKLIISVVATLGIFGVSGFLYFQQRPNLDLAKASSVCVEANKPNFLNGECLSNQQLKDRQNGYIGTFAGDGGRNCWSVGRVQGYGCLPDGKLKLPCDNLSRYKNPPASASTNFDPGEIVCSEKRSVYGLHDIGGEDFLQNRAIKGWTLAYEDIGIDPNNQASKDYTNINLKGAKVITRLDAQTYSTNPSQVPTNGTFPCQNQYPNFIQRVVNFVANSKGSNIWVIGNEMNLISEWPTCNGAKEPITAIKAVELFKQIRARIKTIPGRLNDQVIIGAVSPWPNDLDPSKTGLDYQAEMFNLLKPDEIDGVALHAYTYPGSGMDTTKITSEEKFGNTTLRKHFRVYQDLLQSLPNWAKSLPVYLTEAAPLDGFENINNAWIAAMYSEIRNWNQNPGNQKICAAITYRFKNFDKWGLENKPNLLADYNQALQAQNTQSCPLENNFQQTLLAQDKIIFSPSKAGKVKFKTQDLTLQILNDNLLLNNNQSSTCEFKVKAYGKDNNDLTFGNIYSKNLLTNLSSSALGQYTETNDSFESKYIAGKGCGFTLPASSQSVAKWQFEIRITRSDGVVFKSFASYSFLYGALIVIDITATS